jgi:hypothetical protein
VLSERILIRYPTVGFEGLAVLTALIVLLFLSAAAPNSVPEFRLTVRH